LAFDLAGVRLIPSGMLGMLASIRRQNVAVEIYNPSKDVLEVLEITGLTKIMPVSYTDGDGSPTA
jgi:anti-anti-sigma regulatory factor